MEVPHELGGMRSRSLSERVTKELLTGGRDGSPFAPTHNVPFPRKLSRSPWFRRQSMAFCMVALDTPAFLARVCHRQKYSFVSAHPPTPPQIVAARAPPRCREFTPVPSAVFPSLTVDGLEYLRRNRLFRRFCGPGYPVSWPLPCPCPFLCPFPWGPWRPRRTGDPYADWR